MCFQQGATVHMPDQEDRFPVTEEVLTVDKRTVPSGRVRVETHTETVTAMAEATLETHDVEVERVPVGREIDTIPEVRTEGDVTIVPVVEERLVVERRLVLREEVHIRRRRSVETVSAPVELRRQQVVISREKITHKE
jgi:uncharacterized protein (TIGR02271 family)